MKIENLKKSNQLADIYGKLIKQIAELKKILSKYKSDTDGFDVSKNDQLYQLHISEFGDGSGCQVDLTGFKIGLDVLNFTLIRMEQKKIQLEKEIESL